MAFPFFIRSAYNILREVISMDDAIDNSIRIDGWFAPIMFFLYITIADIAPAVAQASTMLVVKGEDKCLINTSITCISEENSSEILIDDNNKRSNQNELSKDLAGYVFLFYSNLLINYILQLLIIFIVCMSLVLNPI